MKIILLTILLTTSLFAIEKTFEREYTYNASEYDNKVTSRDNALEQVRKLLLADISVFFINEVEWIKGQTFIDGMYINKDIYEQNIKSTIAAITEINVIYQKWDTKIYLLKGEISLDTDDIGEKIKKLIDEGKLGNTALESWLWCAVVGGWNRMALRMLKGVKFGNYLKTV